MKRRLFDFWRNYRRNRTAVLGLCLVLLVVVVAISAPLLFPADPLTMVARPLVAPFQVSDYPLGTDALGRDMLAMLAHGARVSLMVGIVAAATAIAIGVIIGGVAGFYGGVTDNVLMRFTEMVQTMPNFLFALALVSIIGPGLANVVIAIAVVSWPNIARLTRAEFLTLRSREFVQASRAMGMRDSDIIFREILPNALPPVIVLAAVVVAFSILLEAALAFLGVSDQNVTSWGWMIGQGREVMRVAYWLVLFPGLAIVVTVLGISLVGEGLNDALNPHRRRR